MPPLFAGLVVAEQPVGASFADSLPLASFADSLPLASSMPLTSSMPLASFADSMPLTSSMPLEQVEAGEFVPVNQGGGRAQLGDELHDGAVLEWVGWVVEVVAEIKEQKGAIGFFFKLQKVVQAVQATEIGARIAAAGFDVAAQVAEGQPTLWCRGGKGTSAG